MKRFLFIITLVGFITLSAMIYLAHLGGSLTISLPTADTFTLPLWLAIAVIVGIFASLYGVITLLKGLFGLRARIQVWLRRKEALKAERALKKGALAWMAKEMEAAAQHLQQALSFKSYFLGPYLGLIIIHHQEKKYQERDSWIEKLAAEFPKAKLEMGLFQARLYLDEPHPEKACQVLGELYVVYPQHSGLLAYYAEALYSARDFSRLMDLLPSLKVSYFETAEQYVSYAVAAVKGALQKATDEQALLSLWYRLNPLLKKEIAILEEYIQQLIRFKLYHEAEMVVRITFEETAKSELYRLYSRIPYDYHQQILQMEAWLKVNPGSGELLFALGQLCFSYQLWGKARDYFLSSLEQQPIPETYQALGKLFDKLNEAEKSVRCYREGLKLALSDPKQTSGAFLTVMR